MTGCDTVDDQIFLERTSAAAAKAIVERDDWPSTFAGWEHLWEQGTVLAKQSVTPGEFYTGLVTCADFEE